MTQLLRVQPSGWERVDATTAGLLANSPTLAAGNMRAVLSEGKVKSYPDAPSVVQVTTDRIRLIDLDVYGTHTLLDEWVAPAEILHASVNESQVVVALAGGLLKMFVRSAESKLLPIRYEILFALFFLLDSVGQRASVPGRDRGSFLRPNAPRHSVFLKCRCGLLGFEQCRSLHSTYRADNLRKL